MNIHLSFLMMSVILVGSGSLLAEDKFPTPDGDYHIIDGASQDTGHMVVIKTEGKTKEGPRTGSYLVYSATGICIDSGTIKSKTNGRGNIESGKFIWISNKSRLGRIWGTLCWNEKVKDKSRKGRWEYEIAHQKQYGHLSKKVIQNG